MINRQDIRHNARVLSLTNLFCHLFAEEEELYSTLLFREEVGSFNFDNDLYTKIFNGVINNQTEIDEYIIKSAPEWPIGNIPKIDLIILRIAIFELMVDKTQEKSIIIDEAVELAKEFGSDSSSKFVHGVLGSVLS
jgi:N utilization substance protein B